jgi:TolB-like protein
VDRQILSEDNASFAYKGKAIDIKQVGRELGVRYLLEGILQALKTHRREVVAQDVRHHDQIPEQENAALSRSSSGVKPPKS